ncbi:MULTISPECIES: hypothetical protein [Photobacterium]|uniref:DUF1127 domain-containing protein n=1 Tax=Photobacterium alginatilyticum TaxID=1775171 RepID=A0ABW9YFA8_9GAMM|nr:hypothetical protein [Photobacterium alginatilyticum]NBI52301.1 hypothetical protein [Photobacterium alginatilyticum]
MRQSVYLRIAVLLVRLDVHREDAAWRRAHRRIRLDIPHLSEHLLQDIGVGKDYRVENYLLSDKAGRMIRHLRREYKSRLVT